MKKTIIYILLIICTSFLYQCSTNNVIADKIISTKNGVWSKDSIVSINLDITDIIEFYDLFVYIRNRNDYPYSNLYLFVTATAPSGAVVTDTVQYLLADEHGKWKGEGFSKLWDNFFLFRTNIRFPSTGTYNFKINQGMRDTDLIGITDVGIRLTETNK